MKITTNLLLTVACAILLIMLGFGLYNMSNDWKRDLQDRRLKTIGGLSPIAQTNLITYCVTNTLVNPTIKRVINGNVIYYSDVEFNGDVEFKGNVIYHGKHNK